MPLLLELALLTIVDTSHIALLQPLLARTPYSTCPSPHTPSPHTHNSLSLLPSYSLDPSEYSPRRVDAAQVQSNHQNQQHDEGERRGRIDAPQQRIPGTQVTPLVDPKERLERALYGLLVAVDGDAFIGNGKLKGNGLTSLSHDCLELRMNLYK